MTTVRPTVVRPTTARSSASGVGSARARTRASARAAAPGRRALGVLGELALTAGVLVLLFVGWLLWWTDVVAGAEQAETVTRFEQSAAAAGSHGAVAPVSSLIEGDVFAVVRIPRFGSDYARPVLEGTSRDILEHGVGHYTGTAMPGEVGNFAMAGHRTTWSKPFNLIHTLRAGDRIVIETRAGYFVYAVRSWQLVAPWDVSVLTPEPDRPGVAPTSAWLTMTSCHPMFTAQQRYVVHAELEHAYTRAEGLPPSALAAPKD